MSFSTNRMRIVTVIPISKGIGKDTLTYFTQKSVTAGSIVSVPLRNKMVFGLVTESKVAQEMKSELKSLSYNIKKIDNIETHSFISSSFIESAEKIADYNASSVGAVLSALLPKTILEESKELSYTPKEKPVGIFHETLLLQSDDEERYATYKSLIREEFAKNRSVFFCMPGAEDLLNAKLSLEKGIENYTHILHSGLSKKDIVSTWQKIIAEEHPVLIIATGLFLSIPRDDLGAIILEKESSRAYKMQTRPFIDIRSAVEIIAKKFRVKLVLGDIFLRTETLWEEKNGTYADLAPLKFRSLTTATCELIDMKTPQDMKKKEFKILDEKLKKIIIEAKENNEHTFLFCGRKGLFPQTVCSDCGTVVVCKNCNTPVVLYSRKNNGVQKNLFVCNHCGERRDAEELCAHCKGWRLNPLGIGIDRVVEEVKQLIEDVNLVVIDKEHISTHKQAVKARDLFYKTPGSIMVGTEMALTYLNEKIENSAVVSLDSYFSIPDFQINEKIFHILLTLREISQKSLVFQTRQENPKIFDYALRGNLIDFYRDEIEERKSIGYPPFTTYVKMTLEGEKNTVKKMMEAVVELMKPFEVNTFDAFTPGSKLKYTTHGLISLPKGRWIDQELLTKLRNLPPQFMIRIDPITLL
ncbi:MAG: Primosomal protein N' [Parcubacteria group bacterium GW2011_GWF2_40_69]|nr:MAG: Primosomal protein N' [Parcubacteria group bacterium GW2011_GWC1_39_12]KKR19763.1 MAG: Primosomal protein N' [Parcubacteria group bacterium GW2011_GWF1_39_37]KKR34813.1 MAG: Primosomal protein N' [Parcubacteria group bacterium GW2011_GWC2_40_10]KKR52731.1 MAG: Primosomal protein N' [Parcubacteria group bacterium GW2011_GWE1_40_20]KKR64931.1 MAG: Primosomal protein N' [Parcubacteria group bacterium GW2011_GWB1_40_5]KKR69089.1 MAG: Primosomal protein N' [Parcubacteria group bacterium GW2